MFTKIDLEFIAFSQRIVMFMDHFFCVTRKTLILGFVCVNMVYALLYVNFVARTISYWLETSSTDEKALYFVLLVLYVTLFTLHIVSVVIGLLGKSDRSEYFIEQRRGYRLGSLVCLLTVCFVTVQFKYFTAINPIFSAFVEMGYFLLFGLFSCLTIEYLVCTKLPPPLQSRFKAHV
jgi:hypothetical protein